MRKLVLACSFAFVLGACNKEEINGPTSATDPEANQSVSVDNNVKKKHYCFNEERYLERLNNDQEFAERIAAIEAHTEAYNASLKTEKADLPIYTVNVAVNVIHRSEVPISRESIRRQIAFLNQAFSGQDTDRAAVPQMFRRFIAGDTRIRFDLKRIRFRRNQKRFTNAEDLFFDVEGGIDPLNPDTTINIYISNAENFTEVVFGVAALPGTEPEVDHIFIDVATVGPTPSPGLFSEGKVLVHEMGHYLNLFHLPGLQTENCRFDDRVGDTPNSSELYGGAPELGSQSTTCGSQDMFMNYMGVSYNFIVEMFTIGQRNRMRATLAPRGPRRNFVQTSNE